MPGLCLEVRAHLCTTLQRRVLDQPRMPDGSRSLTLTPCDLRVFQTLALDYFNGATGRCDPGYRAIAARARVALGTVTHATRRLQAAGWLTWRRVLRYVHGTLRWARAYILPDAPPELRSRLAAKPAFKKRAVDKAPPPAPRRASPPPAHLAPHHLALARAALAAGHPAASPGILRPRHPRAYPGGRGG